MELSAMADESKVKCDWAPLTPAKSIPLRYEIDSTGIGSIQNPKHQFRGKLGYEERECVNYGCEHADFGGFCFGKFTRNCDRAECGKGCCASLADKVGFMVSENPGSSRLELLGLNGKPEGIMVEISDKRPCQETIELEASLVSEFGSDFHNHILHCKFGSGSTKASNEANVQTPKRSKQGKKRLRMKRHRPKVYDRTKIKKKSSTPKPTMHPSTPKPQTPKRPKFMKDDNLEKPSVEPSRNVDQELVFDSNEKNCRRKLEFDIENPDMNQKSNILDERESKSVVESKPRVEIKLPVDRFSSMRVYTRIFRPNECLKNSRKLGPNCPAVFKKARMRRLKPTAFDKFIRLISTIQLITQRRKMAAVNELRNLDQIVRERKTKTRTLFSRRRRMIWEAVKHPISENCISNSTWMARRERSKTPIRRKRDLSSFVTDLSKFQLPETFLPIPSNIRNKDTGSDKLAARAVAQDEGICNLDKKEMIEHQELPRHNVVSCNEGIQHLGKKEQIEQQELPQDNVFFCDESIQKFPADFEEHMVGVKMCLPKCHSNIHDMYRSGKKSLDTDIEIPSVIGSSDEEEENVSASQDYDAFTRALVDFASQKMECLNIDDGNNQLVIRNQNGALIIPSKEKSDLPKKRQLPKVDLDPETIRVFNLLMANSESKDAEQEDDERAKYWREERALFEGRLDEFIAVMNLIQGDRRFSPWKGSVVDSVVGVFLTQNVSDHLSSSAFMSLAARYPAPSVSEHSGSDGISEIVIHDIEQVRIAAEPPSECKQLLMIEMDHTSCHSNEIGVDPVSSSLTISTPGKRKGKHEDKQETGHWDELRVKYFRAKNRTDRTLDSVDWEAVRQTPVNELAKVIMERGMNNLLAARIKDFLDRLVRDHGSLDLEWLRDVPPDKAKEYLLSISGLGLKSVECVRLLSLHHPAFPVDVNIARVSTRNAWVPLQPLPEGVEIHLLNQYPDLDSVQQFLWPRLKHIPHAKLYEAHYHLILFGKTICTKKQPNCGACPFTAKCKHYASMCASARPRLEGFHEENVAQSSYESSQDSSHDSTVKTSQLILPSSDDDLYSASGCSSRNCEPIIEIPESPVRECTAETDVDACTPSLEDIEDFGLGNEMPTLILSVRGREDAASKALITLRPGVATRPRPKLKNVERLRTVHHVYELPDSHPLLAGFERREPEDPCPYLLAIWMTDETTSSSQEPKKTNCHESIKCDTCTCSGEIVKYQDEQMVQGTILLPCRTASRGSFPLNGTYFQVNEVFADHDSSRQPVDVPREWVWNLKRRGLYCGTSVQSICRDMSKMEIGCFFKEGSLCIRGFDKITRGPRPLARRFHICKTRQVDKE